MFSKIIPFRPGETFNERHERRERHARLSINVLRKWGERNGFHITELIDKRYRIRIERGGKYYVWDPFKGRIYWKMETGRIWNQKIYDVYQTMTFLLEKGRTG